VFEKKYTVREAAVRDETEIAGLVVEGFIDKFRPIFGRGMDRSVWIMEKWVRLEHAVGGVRSIVIEVSATGELAASVGVRVGESDDDALSGGLWEALRNSLGFLRASWAATLLSYPRYGASSSEAYVERLVVSPAHRNLGMARALLDASEDLARETGKATIGLHVSSGNIPALRLYESYGYEEVAEQRSMITGYFLGIRNWLYLRKEI
jgi:ribosomal protein S18 acetylase RimI-like enzyme